jgi:hypothetical protein
MSDEDVPCPDPNEVVTRAILREELANFATKSDLANHPTKDELRTELATFATKDDLRVLKDDLRAEFATKDDLRVMKDEVAAMLAAMEGRQSEALLAQENRLLDELARHSNANHESLLANMRLMFERYTDHPKRITEHDERIAGHDERIDDHEDRIVRLELQPAPQPRTRTRSRARIARKPKRSRR